MSAHVAHLIIAQLAADLRGPLPPDYELCVCWNSLRVDGPYVGVQPDAAPVAQQSVARLTATSEGVSVASFCPISVQSKRDFALDDPDVFANVVAYVLECVALHVDAFQTQQERWLTDRLRSMERCR